MTDAAIITTAAGSRHVPAGDWPLSLGGEGAALVCSGVEAGVVLAHVGVAHGHPFVAPARPSPSVMHNERALDESAWLQHGDRLRAGGTQVHVATRGRTLVLTVSDAGDADAPTPPRAPPPLADAAPGTANADGPRIELRSPRRRPSILSLAALAAFAVLASVAAFVFLSAAVTIRVTPPPEQLALEGFFPHLRFGDRYLMLSGDYRFRASRRGYRDLDETVQVVRGRHLELDYRMQKLPGVLELSTDPPRGVAIAVDGEALGETPLERFELPAGTHRLRAVADRYVTEEREIAVEGMGNVQAFTIALTPRWATVSFSSDPQGAEVWIGDALQGNTPLGLDLLEGVHRVELRKAGYKTASSSVTVVANQPLSVPAFALAPADATVLVNSVPDGASVTLDDAFAGRTPVTLTISPGESHRIDVSRAGHASASRTLELQPSEHRTMLVSLAPRLGVVFITSDPADAELVVDGASLGMATGRHELTTIPHAIELRRDGYEPHRVTLTPRAATSQKLDVTLERIHRSAKNTIKTGQGQVLTLVPSGRVRMGASRRVPGRRANEALRSAVLQRPFYIALDEVTNAQFRRFDPSHTSGPGLDGDTAPVANVTWEQAARYLNWLSRADSLPPAYEERGKQMAAVRPPTTGYRLPTEAEWEYVARAVGRKEQATYPWGGEFPPGGRAGNYADRSARGTVSQVIAGYDDGYPSSAPVGSFTAGPLGVHDMGGNVAEWTNDHYSTRGDADGAVDPLGPSSGRHRVVRGSSWRHAGVGELRLSYRDYSDKARSDLGFRIARYAD